MYIGYIYKTTNLINNRCYIGKRTKPIFDKNYYGSGIALQSAIKKYGKDNFKIEILHWAKTVDELNQLEIDAISLYESLNDLYNIASGGDGGNTILNHPNKNTIINQRNIGLTKWHASLTEEEKATRSKKISEAKKGKSNGHFGYKHTPETIEKIKASNKNYTKSAEWKKAHAEASAKRKGKPFTQKYKPVIINNIEYPSIKDAMIDLGIKHRATFYTMVKQQKISMVYKNDL